MLCLKTENIFQDYEQLKAKGVQFFSGINEVAPGKYYVAFQDPEGNLLELIQK
ncbi:MAG TPA: VOC family protein [Anaerolineae bacterium]|nr:VOC family protein [Anaerolineae bacterium]HXV97964.1 VOC family protein [Anaerolineae bacterium]